MNFLAVSLATIFAAAAVPASAAPLSTPFQPATGGLVVKIGGCHDDVRDTYIPEIGRRAPHYHDRDSCRPVLVGGRQQPSRRSADCHRDVRTHRVDGIVLRHRHVGDDCRVREVRRANDFSPN